MASSASKSQVTMKWKLEVRPHNASTGKHLDDCVKREEGFGSKNLSVGGKKPSVNPSRPAPAKPDAKWQQVSQVGLRR